MAQLQQSKRANIDHGGRYGDSQYSLRPAGKGREATGNKAFEEFESALAVCCLRKHSLASLLGVNVPAQAWLNSTPDSTTASSRLGAVSTATNPSPSFQMLALSVSPGNTTPANRTP